MKLTADNVKVGDTLYVVPSDTRLKHWYFTVGKIARKYIFDENGWHKIEIGTNEIYHKDGIGAREYVYLSEEAYEHICRCTSLAHKMSNSSHIYNEMSVEDIEAITKIMCKYDKEWSERK